MDVDKYAPFTSSPLDASRGRGRRYMLPRLRPLTFTSSGAIRRSVSGAVSASPIEATPTVVVFLTPPSVAPATAAGGLGGGIQQTVPQVGGPNNGRSTK